MLGKDCHYDSESAERVRQFFRQFLVHTKGQWNNKPFELLGWQWNIVKELFGNKRENGLRQYTKAYIEIPKKNGKSTLCAGLALYMLIADNEPGGEIYLAASDREQAGIIYREASAMVRANPTLNNKCVCIDSKKVIQYPRTNSIIRALSADAYRQEGLNASCIIFDELHAQPNADLWNALEYSTSARQQPLLISITTAGSNRQSICYKQREYAERVRDKVIDDDSYLPIIFSANINEDWTKETTWKKANPSFGITIKEESFKTDFLKAFNSSTVENKFRRYRLNQWTQQDVRWIRLTDWDKCKEDFCLEDMLGRDCFVGLDLSATQDLTSLSMLFKMEDGSYRVLVEHWIPSDNIENRARHDKVPYDVWAKKKLIHTTDGNSIDYEAIINRIKEISNLVCIREIAIDRWNAQSVMTNLTAEGFQVIPFGQGYGSFLAPSKEFERLILSGNLKHDGNDLLRWQAGNIAVDTDSHNNIKPSKKKSTERIDGLVATIMALGRAMEALPETANNISFEYI